MVFSFIITTQSFVGNLTLYKYYFSHENESHSFMSDSFRPHGLYSPWNSPGQNTGVGSLSFHPGDLPNPGIEPRSPTLQADSLPDEPLGKPKNTGEGSLFLLQGNLSDPLINLGAPALQVDSYNL